jgi:hypothetical protein
MQNMEEFKDEKGNLQKGTSFVWPLTSHRGLCVLCAACAKEMFADKEHMSP